MHNKTFTADRKKPRLLKSTLHYELNTLSETILLHSTIYKKTATVYIFVPARRKIQDILNLPTKRRKHPVQIFLIIRIEKIQVV